VKPTTLVWKQGVPNCVEASRVKGLQFGATRDACETESTAASAPKATPSNAAVPAEPLSSRLRRDFSQPRTITFVLVSIAVVAALSLVALIAMRNSSSQSQGRSRTADLIDETPSDGFASLVLGAVSPSDPNLETDGISLGMTLAQVGSKCTVRQPALAAGELWPIVYSGSPNGAAGGEEFEFLFDRHGKLVAYQKRLFRDSFRSAIDRIVARFGKTERPVFTGYQGNSFAWYHFKDAIVGALLPAPRVSNTNTYDYRGRKTGFDRVVQDNVRLSVWSKQWLVGELQRLDSELRRQNLKVLQECWNIAGRAGTSGDDLPAPRGCTWKGESMQSKLTEATFFLGSSNFPSSENVGSVSYESATFFDGVVSAAEDVDVSPDILRAQDWRQGALVARGSDSEFLVISVLYPLAAHALALLVADYFPPGSEGIEWRGEPSGCYSWLSGHDTQVYVDGLWVTLKRMR